MKTAPTMAKTRAATERQKATRALRLLSFLESRGERTNHAFINASNTKHFIVWVRVEYVLKLCVGRAK